MTFVKLGTEENTILISAIGSGITIVLGGMALYFRALNRELQSLRGEIIQLQTQVRPLWRRVEAQIASDLHHPHSRYFEMDKLLEKLEVLSIQPDERVRLKQLLLERSIDTHSDVDDGQRAKAKFMIQVMDLVLLEAAEQAPNQLQVAVIETNRAAVQTAIAAEAVKEAKKVAEAKDDPKK